MTSLPEGAEVRVALVDAVELDDKDRAELHAALLAAEAEVDAGKPVSEADLWARLGTTKCGSSPSDKPPSLPT